MKRFLKSKKGIVLLATLVVVGALAGGAAAFFTNSGTTNGTPVTVGNSGTNFAVALNSQLNPNLAAKATSYTNGQSALLPTGIGDSNADVATVPFTITNTSEANENLNSYTVAIENADHTAWFNCADGTTAGQLAANSGLCNDASTPCTAADFSINGGSAGNSPVTINNLGDDLSPLSDAPSNSYAGSFTLQLVDLSHNQDNCRGQTPNITVSATS